MMVRTSMRTTPIFFFRTEKNSILTTDPEPCQNYHTGRPFLHPYFPLPNSYFAFLTEGFHSSSEASTHPNSFRNLPKNVCILSKGLYSSSEAYTDPICPADGVVRKTIRVSHIDKPSRDRSQGGVAGPTPVCRHACTQVHFDWRQTRQKYRRPRTTHGPLSPSSRIDPPPQSAHVNPATTCTLK